MRRPARRPTRRNPRNPTSPSPAAVARLAEFMKAQILQDVAAGRVPPTVRSFAELHDYVDANFYGHVVVDGEWVASDPSLRADRFPDWDPDTLGELIHADACNAAENKVDAWIRAGGLRAAPAPKRRRK